jgi:hypothetical protein
VDGDAAAAGHGAADFVAGQRVAALAGATKRVARAPFDMDAMFAMLKSMVIRDPPRLPPDPR